MATKKAKRSPRSTKLTPKGQTKLQKTMKEFAAGTLKDSSGRLVKSRKRALAIGISQGRALGGKR